ncbi:MAG TPA: hypothetical protein VFU88_21415 [Ktedonobacterales bacterium]|nr:hypothetical protein [Ktedonobacterales bacterium]
MSSPSRRHPTGPARAAPSSPAEPLAAYAETLAAIGAAFGLDAERLAAAEDLERLEALTRLPFERLTAIAAAEVGKWFARFGIDLELDLQLTGLGLPEPAEPVTLHAEGAPEGAFAHFLRDAEHAASDSGSPVEVQVRLALGKTQALAAAHATLAGRPGYLGSAEALEVTTVAVFYSADAFVPLLSPDQLPAWQASALARDDGRAVVFLLDIAGALVGPALEVIGACELATLPWLELTQAGWHAFQQQTADARALREAESIWTLPASALTSVALDLATRSEGLEAIDQRVAALREQIAAMELATAVQSRDDERLVLRFAGQPVRVCVLPAPDTGGGRGAVSRLSGWAYASATPDRLYIARDCLARQFPAGPHITVADLAGAARLALPAALATFDLYLKRQADTYFAARQQARDAVASYAADVRKAFADLASDVTDNVYRTVVLALGVVIASIVEPAASVFVAALGALLFGGYLIGFCWYFLMRSRQTRFERERAQFEQRLADVPGLTEDERATYLGRPEGDEAEFWRSYHAARRIYLWLGVASVVVFGVLLLGHALGVPPLAATGAPVPSATAAPEP